MVRLKLVTLLLMGGLCIVFNQLNAQTTVGLQIGVYDSQTTLIIIPEEADYIINKGNLISPTVGLYLRTPLNQFLSFRTGLSYMREGTFFESFAGEKGTKMIIDIDFIKLSTELEIGFDLPHYGVSLFGGPFLGYGLRLSERRLDDGPEYQYRTTTLSFKEQNIKRFDYGIYLGGELRKAISKRFTAFLGFTYQLGLQELAKQDDFNNYSEGKSIFLGVRISLK